MGGRPVRRLSAPLPPPDCETLIRRMLVVEPAKRITIAQIRQHRWMQAEPALVLPACPGFSLLGYTSSVGDYDEQALGIMQMLGVDRKKTVEVSRLAACLPACLPWWGRGRLPWVADRRSWLLPARLEWEQHGSFKGCLSARKDTLIRPRITLEWSRQGPSLLPAPL